MTQYIYFVKCPNCEDEHFDFFDDAKAFALSCLGCKPIITQTEVCRNDFGECTDSADLGTVWSWEDLMQDIPSDNETVFSKRETFGISEDFDAFDDFEVGPQVDEFDMLDNSVHPDAGQVSIVLEDGRKLSKEALYNEIVVNGGEVEIPVGDLGLSSAYARFQDGGRYSDTTLAVSMHNGLFAITEFHTSEDGDCTDGDSFEFESFEELWNELISYKNIQLDESTRKPVPAGMTIKQLVEEMEENEDTVECTWCEELFDKSECRYEVDMGWLCDRCQAAIMSRGEPLTFRENTYWDFLDEDIDLDESVSLEEAYYRNLINLPDARERILERARLDERSLGIIDNNGNIIRATVKVAAPGTYSGLTAGEIINFNLDQRGELVVSVDRGNGHIVDMTVYDLLHGRALQSSLKRDCRAYKLVKALETAADSLNREIGTAGGRNLNAVADVRNNPAVAQELRDHIVKIIYEIPLDTYTESDFVVTGTKDVNETDDDIEKAIYKAIANLDEIRNTFNNWQYSQAAIAAGLVKNRPVFIKDVDDNIKLNDTRISNIATQWHAAAKIFLDCRIEELSNSAQDLIDKALIKSSVNDIKDRNTFDCIRLARALTEYFDDAEFYN
jgi:hypothetical protein